MVDREDDAGGSTTRRRMLAALGGAMGGLAGCVISASPVTDSSTVFGHSFPYLPKQAQLNPWSMNYPFKLTAVVFEPLAVTAPGEPWRRGDVLESVAVDGTEATLRFSDEFSWWNGEPVTARDHWIAERIDELREGTNGRAPTQVDDYTLRYELDEPLDRPLVFSEVLNETLKTAEWVFEPWLEKLTDATTATRRESVGEDLREWKLYLEEAAERGFGCGPYRFTEVSSNRLMLERFEDHPRAGELSIPRLWLPAVRGGRADDLRERGWLDGGRGTVGGRNTPVPEYIEQLAEYPTTGGTKLAVNWHNEHLARRPVRRAIACALPMRTLTRSAGWGKASSLQTGMTGPPEQRWLDDDLRESLRRYPVESDAERAAANLREAGYERRGERWVGPDGREAKLRLQTPHWSNWVSTANFIRDKLESIGFVVKVDQVPNTAFRTVSRRREFDLLLVWTDGKPHQAYDVTSELLSSLGYGVADPATETAPDGRPVTPEIPAEPGSDSEFRQVNLVEQWRRIRRPTSTAVTREAVGLFARWWNYDLPHIDFATNVTGVWGNTRDFAWPESDAPAYRWSGPVNRPEYHLLRTGAIRPADGG